MDEWFIFPACLLHQGWLKLIEVSLVGTFSFTAFSQPAWNSCHSIFPLVSVLYLAVNWVPAAFRSVCDWPTLARLHKRMVRRRGYVRFAVMFETAMVISWSLSPSTGMHLVTGVCLFVKKQVEFGFTSTKVDQHPTVQGRCRATCQGRCYSMPRCISDLLYSFDQSISGKLVTYKEHGSGKLLRNRTD